MVMNTFFFFLHDSESYGVKYTGDWYNCPIGIKGQLSEHLRKTLISPWLSESRGSNSQRGHQLKNEKVWIKAQKKIAASSNKNDHKTLQTGIFRLHQMWDKAMVECPLLGWEIQPGLPKWPSVLLAWLTVTKGNLFKVCWRSCGML